MKNLKILAVVAMVLLTGCQAKSDYDKAMSLIAGLETEVMQCTTQAEYDEVHERIILIDDNPLLQKKDYSKTEVAAIITSATKLMQKALAVKAILYVMPADVNPTEGDMEKLVNDCMDKKLNYGIAPYSEVVELVKAYYNKK